MRSSLGGIREGIRERKETAILINSTFCGSGFFGRSLVYRRSFIGENKGRYKRRES